eukprot:CAMPEP_0197076658 /NCGR_PEP_ID=MMETSP1384-20130603/212227_1 /TAXON_ID=29189 /ORGANISM="Ammonia sp." /LENGTH=710 /DNA_ID=CAMNT_0042515517 /DNA_START=1 /DNA_END=2134 /DNA_ORIENTATION=+
MSAGSKFGCRNCCKSTDELNDIASTIQAYTSIHFNREEWIKLRFVCMLYSCIIFMWTIMDSIFSDRTLFYFIYATHWMLLLTSMLYLICSYVITLVIHERIGTNHDENHTKITIINNKRDNKNNHFQDMHLQQKDNNIPSLTDLGLFKWNQFIVFLQNASLSPCIVFPVIFWFVIFPNIGHNHTWYDILLEFHIHAVIPVLILFDFTFSSRTVLYIDIYQPLIIGIVYCLWTYLIFTDVTSKSDGESTDDEKPSYFYDRYYYFEINDFVVWFILNLSALCGVHLIFSFIKFKVLSMHFLPIQLSSNHTVLIDRNGHIVNSKHKQYEKIKTLKPKKRKKNKRKKDEPAQLDDDEEEEEVALNINGNDNDNKQGDEVQQQPKDVKPGKSKKSKHSKKKQKKHKKEAAKSPPEAIREDQDPETKKRKKNKRKKDEPAQLDDEEEEEEVALNINGNDNKQDDEVQQQPKDAKPGKSKKSKHSKKKQKKHKKEAAKSPPADEDAMNDAESPKEKPSKPQKQNKTNTSTMSKDECHDDEDKEDKALIAPNNEPKTNSVKHSKQSTNSIKQGFKNLIAIVDANEADMKAKSNERESDDDEEESDSSTTSGDDEEDDDEEESEEDPQQHKQQVQRFYSLKGNESDMVTDDENGGDAFKAIRTKSMAALLSLSKSLHTISSSYKASGVYKSEIEYSETSGISDEEIQFGLKSGLYKNKK